MLIRDKNILRNKEGQAIFELVFFLPFIIFLVTVMINIGNSINSGINQQKVVRGYFYYLNKQNAKFPVMIDLSDPGRASLQYIGFSAIGWTNTLASKSTTAPCFKFQRLFSDDEGETCEEPLANESKSSFVRIKTVYGVCGESYRRNSQAGFFKPDFSNKLLGSCQLQ